MIHSDIGPIDGAVMAIGAHTGPVPEGRLVTVRTVLNIRVDKGDGRPVGIGVAIPAVAGPVIRWGSVTCGTQILSSMIHLDLVPRDGVVAD